MRPPYDLSTPGWRNWRYAIGLNPMARKGMWVRIPPRAPDALLTGAQLDRWYGVEALRGTLSDGSLCSTAHRGGRPPWAFAAVASSDRRAADPTHAAGQPPRIRGAGFALPAAPAFVL